MRRATRALLAPAVLLATAVLTMAGSAPAAGQAPGGASGIPERLSDREFWRLVTELSEPDGYFRSDNLTSNELQLQFVIPALVSRTRPSGVYLGVGPEQNFTYIAALKPRLAVIVDIRRGNLALHLMYKALFELAADRAEFVSLLFSKPRPGGLGRESTAVQLFEAFRRSPTSDEHYKKNLAAIRACLTGTHGFPLSQADLSAIEVVYQAFYWSGFALRSAPTYDELMTATDEAGVPRSYLAGESNFMFLKDLQARNLLVPVVGDFAGPKALRAVGSLVRSYGATVTAFYLSNVEQYLVPDLTWDAFCRNVAAMPLDGSSTFIRSASGGNRGRGFWSSLGGMAEEVRACASAPPVPPGVAGAVGR